MGGALTVPGNVSPCAEANIANDPEAADLIFRSELLTRMIGLDVTHQAHLAKSETVAWRELGTPAGVFLADMSDFYIDYYVSREPFRPGCCLHDPLAVAAAIDPTLVTYLPINMKVDVAGPERGRTIGDTAHLFDPRKTSQVAVGVDVARFREEFFRRVGRALAQAGK